MFKKLFIYTFLIFLIFVGIFIISINFFTTHIQKQIEISLSNMEYNNKFDDIWNNVYNTKKLLSKYYYDLYKNYIAKQKIKALNQFNQIKIVLDTLDKLHIRKKKLFLNQLLLKNNFNNLKILDKNLFIIASNNILDISKKANLPCDPLKNFGICQKKTKNKIFFVSYLPKYKIYIINNINLNFNTEEIITLLKNMENIIAIQNGKIIKGNITNDGFYIMEYIKPLNLFIAKKIKYSSFETIKTYFKILNKKLKCQIYKYIYIFVSLFIIFYYLFYLIYKKEIDLIDNYIKSIKNESFIDKLTQVYNRKIIKELNINKFNNLVIMDLDNFKYINDTFGHEKGDFILKKFAEILKKHFEITIRWGGDEFIILTNKNLEEIKKIISKINKSIFFLQSAFDKEKREILSVSAGICNNKNLPYEERFKNADLALYKVKKSKKGNALSFREIDYIKLEEH